MFNEELKNEQRILIQMQKTLNNIVREVTPPAGIPNPLSNGTLEEIKYCFAVISKREKELADKLNVEPIEPHFGDAEQSTSGSLSFVKLPRRRSQSA
jgi:hypothetical protein